MSFFLLDGLPRTAKRLQAQRKTRKQYTSDGAGRAHAQEAAKKSQRRLPRGEAAARWYSVYLLYQYECTNTDTEGCCVKELNELSGAAAV
jgi:hypothetical protein